MYNIGCIMMYCLMFWINLLFYSCLKFLGYIIIKLVGRCYFLFDDVFMVRNVRLFICKYFFIVFLGN